MIKYAYQVNNELIMIEKDNGGNESRYGKLQNYTNNSLTYERDGMIYYETLENDLTLILRESRFKY